MNIRGPSRTTEERAQKDLEEIRKAGTKGKTREEGLEFMRDEAQKLKDSAQPAKVGSQPPEEEVMELLI